MARRVSCRRCGLPAPASLCARCRAQTYDSAEYRANSARVRSRARAAIRGGIPIPCAICAQYITSETDVTVEHIRSVNCGGSNAMDNLGPSHRRCNYGHH
jgi:5-methylcytosine-specific restriction endonuclease McrA